MEIPRKTGSEDVQEDIECFGQSCQDAQVKEGPMENGLPGE